jgi:hypothetical protein
MKYKSNMLHSWITMFKFLTVPCFPQEHYQIEQWSEGHDYSLYLLIARTLVYSLYILQTYNKQST